MHYVTINTNSVCHYICMYIRWHRKTRRLVITVHTRYLRCNSNKNRAQKNYVDITFLSITLYKTDKKLLITSVRCFFWAGVRRHADILITATSTIIAFRLPLEKRQITAAGQVWAKSNFSQLIVLTKDTGYHRTFIGLFSPTVNRLPITTTRLKPPIIRLVLDWTLC